MFTKGHKLSKGGKRPNSGRKPDEFRAKLLEMINSPKTQKFLIDVLAGKLIEEVIVRHNTDGTKTTTKHERTPSLENRLKVFHEISDKVIAKPQDDSVKQTLITQIMTLIHSLLDRVILSHCPHCKADLNQRSAIALELERLSDQLADPTYLETLSTRS